VKAGPKTGCDVIDNSNCPGKQFMTPCELRPEVIPYTKQNRNPKVVISQLRERNMAWISSYYLLLILLPTTFG